MRNSAVRNSVLKVRANLLGKIKMCSDKWQLYTKTNLCSDCNCNVPVASTKVCTAATRLVQYMYATFPEQINHRRLLLQQSESSQMESCCGPQHESASPTWSFFHKVLKSWMWLPDYRIPWMCCATSDRKPALRLFEKFIFFKDGLLCYEAFALGTPLSAGFKCCHRYLPLNMSTVSHNPFESLDVTCARAHITRFMNMSNHWTSVTNPQISSIVTEGWLKRTDLATTYTARS